MTTTKPNPTNYVRVDESSNIKRVNEDNSSTPIVEAVENENVEASKTIVDTWYIVPTNAKGVEIQVNALGAGVKATVEYSLDRAGVTAGSTTTVEDWASGEITNKVQSASFGAIAGVRMKNITTNEVKNYLSTNLTGANNDLVWTEKTFGTLPTVEYLDPSDINQSLAITVVDNDMTVSLATDGAGAITSTADDIKTAFALVAEAVALFDVADKAGNDGSGVVTALAKTAVSGGSAATLPKMFITVV